MIVKEDIENLAGKNIVIIGDLMLDEYVHGAIDRISPEAPVPVLLEKNRTYRLGGAANVALNIQKMESHAYLIGVIGDDKAGERITSLISKQNLEGVLLLDKSRPTTVKTRLIAHGQQVLRVDKETSIDVEQSINKEILVHLKEIFMHNKIDGLILQDYNKGVLNKENIAPIIALAKKEDIPIFVDPKKKNFLEYKGVNIFKPNKIELDTAVQNKDTLREKMEVIIKAIHSEMIICTLAADGISYLKNEDFEIIPTEKIDVVDVSGAGDSAISAIVLSYCAGHSANKICTIGNISGTLACKKAEVSPVSLNEMKAIFYF